MERQAGRERVHGKRGDRRHRAGEELLRGRERVRDLRHAGHEQRRRQHHLSWEHAARLQGERGWIREEAGYWQTRGGCPRAIRGLAINAEAVKPNVAGGLCVKGPNIENEPLGDPSGDPISRGMKATNINSDK